MSYNHLMQSDVTVPLELSKDRSIEERHEAIKVFLSPVLLDSIRLYLTLLPDIEYELNMAQVAVLSASFFSSFK